MVLVHGVGSSSHIWDLTAPLLADQLVRVVAMDQRGHGESDQPDSGYDFASVVADLAGFMDAVPPSGFDVPNPSDQLGPDEEPYEGEEAPATGGPDPMAPDEA